MPFPISPHNALLCASRRLRLRHAIMVSAAYLTHSYANIGFPLNIWWQEFLQLSALRPADYTAIAPPPRKRRVA